MVLDANIKQFLCDARQKKNMVKKEHMRNSKFVKKLGNGNQNTMSAWVVRCFLLCEALFAPHCNDVFMHDRLNASIDVVSLV